MRLRVRARLLYEYTSTRKRKHENNVVNREANEESEREFWSEWSGSGASRENLSLYISLEKNERGDGEKSEGKKESE